MLRDAENVLHDAEEMLRDARREANCMSMGFGARFKYIAKCESREKLLFQNHVNYRSTS